MNLTVEQEKKIIDFWNRTPDEPPDLKDIIVEVFGQSFDNRSKEGKAVKEALSKFGMKAKTPSDYSPKTAQVQLTEEQKTLIINNAATMNSLELARLAFNNQNLTNLNAETRVVNDYVKSLDTTVVYNAQENEDIPMADYEPPNTLDKALKRVNKYINFTLDKDRLTSQQKKGLEMLVNYLHTYRFVRQMNSFGSEQDRMSCEDAFVRYAYDKPDLTQEEVDQYIELANQVVAGIKTYRRKDILEDRLARVVGNDQETLKVSIGLVDAIGKAGTEYDQCMKRQQKLLEDLKEKRSTRLSKAIKENASILNLVRDWRDEEQRVKMLKYVQIEQDRVASEVEKLTNMAEIKARILGLNKDLILDG